MAKNKGNYIYLTPYIRAVDDELRRLQKARSLAVLEAAKGTRLDGPCPKCGRAHGDDGCNLQPCPMGLGPHP